MQKGNQVKPKHLPSAHLSERLLDDLRSTDPLVWYTVSIRILVTGVPLPVPVGVLLTRVRHVDAVILGRRRHRVKQMAENNPSGNPTRCFSHLFTAGIFALQLLVRVAVDVRVLPTQVSVTSPANSTLWRQERPSGTLINTEGPEFKLKTGSDTWQVTEPSRSVMHWALASQGLVRLFPQLICGLHPFT